VYEVTCARFAIARNPDAARGKIFERVLADVVSALKQHRASAEVHSMAGATFSLCVGVPHRDFRVPRTVRKS
jgi:hypothetical protein